MHLKDSSHGGEDVALFSNHWPELVRGVKEQNVVAHIMAYTSCIGPYTNEGHCDDSEVRSSKVWIYVVVGIIAISFLIFYFLKRNHYI